MGIAGQPVEPGDDERGFVAAALVERGGELGAVGVPFAALDLLELGELGSAVSEAHGAVELSFQPKTALAHAVGRNPVIGHKCAHAV